MDLETCKETVNELREYIEKVEAIRHQIYMLNAVDFAEFTTKFDEWILTQTFDILTGFQVCYWIMVREQILPWEIELE